jgi:hypothetical protein
MPSQEVDPAVFGQNLEIIVLHAVPSVNDVGHIMLPAVQGEGDGSFVGSVTRVGGDLDGLGQVVFFHGPFFIAPGQAARELNTRHQSDLVEEILKFFDHRDLDLF